MIAYLRRLSPGILLCIAITVIAIALQTVEVHFAGHAYLEALVLAILLGVALRTAWTPPEHLVPGIAFSAKLLLEFAVVMLGASVSVATVLALGPILLVGIASVVAIALGSSFIICRGFGLPLASRYCLFAAIRSAAIRPLPPAPVIGADGDGIAASISFTAVLGVVVVLTLPLLCRSCIVAHAIWRAGRPDRLRGAASAGGDFADRRVEQSGRHGDQAGAGADARPGGARTVTARPRPASRPAARSCQPPQPRLARAGAVVHHRLSRGPDRALAWADPAKRFANHHPCGRDIDDHLDGGARPRRRCARRGEERRAGDAGGDRVADHSA